MGVMESEEKKLEKERKKLEADKNKLELEKAKLKLKQDKENFEKEKKKLEKENSDIKNESLADTDSDENNGSDLADAAFWIPIICLVTLKWIGGADSESPYLWATIRSIALMTGIGLAIAGIVEAKKTGKSIFAFILNLAFLILLIYAMVTGNIDPKSRIKDIKINPSTWNY